MSTTNLEEPTEASKTKPLSLRRNFSWTLAGDVTFGACQWGMLALLAKVTTPEKVGEYSLALAITAPIILFASLNTRQVQATDARRTHPFGEYLGLRLIMLLLSSIVITGVVLVTRPGLEAILVIAMVTLAKIFDSLSDVMYGLLQQNERMDYISISRIIQGVLQLVVFGTTVYLTKSLVLGTLVMAVGSGFVTIFYDIRMAARVAAGKSEDVRLLSSVSRQIISVMTPIWNIPSLWMLACLSFPLGVVTVLGTLNLNVPRYFLQDYAGARELGIFSTMWTMLYPFGIAVSSIVQSVTPRLSHYYIHDLAKFKHLFSYLLAFALATGTVGILMSRFVGRALLSLLFRPEYASHPVAFQWIMVAATTVFVTTALSGAINATRQFKLQPFILLLALGSNLLACAFLVPHYQVLGACWAYLIGCAVWMIGFAALLISVLNSRENFLILKTADAS